MFAGFGGASFSLKKAGIDFECVGFSEIDKDAIRNYIQNHSCHHIINYGDCTKIDTNELPDFDLLTGGFPCQSFSAAGKRMGEQDTRGTLFHEIIRIAEVKKPKYILLENVKGLTTKRHKQTFTKMLSELSRIGYYVQWKVLNSKDYGIPQNRERVFFVCFRNYVDCAKFRWPCQEILKIFLKDILEEDVDEKYFLKKEKSDELIKDLIFKQKFSKKERKIIQLNKPSHSNNRVYDPNGISPTLRSMSSGGNIQPFIIASRGRYVKNKDNKKITKQNAEPRFDGLTNTITSVQKDNYVADKLRVRKLTEKECFRLMGFLDDQIKLKDIKKTQKYKLAGNGWDINLISKILKEMIR